VCKRKEALPFRKLDFDFALLPFALAETDDTRLVVGRRYPHVLYASLLARPAGREGIGKLIRVCP
jgi:hypothetical protein